MLPALTPTQTVSRSDGRRSARPEARIQWQRYAASPPSTSNTSVSRTAGTQRSSSRLGRAVSSRTPTDFQPRPTVGVPVSCPLMQSHAWRGPAIGCPYSAVGMHRAVDSAIGLPSRSTSASRMLAFLMPADVRRNFKLPPWLDGGSRVLGEGCESETVHLLRPAAGHCDLSRPQPRRLLVGHVDDGEAAEVLLALDVRAVREQRAAA